MNAERWDRIQSLFHEAAALPESERRAFLKSSTSGDPGLVAEVLALLDEDSRGGSLIDRDIATVASDVIDGDAYSLPTHQFGPYRVTGILGEGGMGVVYLAERADLDAKAAIKILRDAWLSPARRDRFMAERRTLAHLEHPSIARLYDSGSLPDGTPWFVMEHVEGTPITTYCRAHSSTVRERLLLFRDVCEAVQFAHSSLVVHRDLKPSNILVRADGTVKLLDFGISKQLDTLDSAAEQTRTTIRMMTPAYAAPEQIRGDPVGLHTDVYSLGVILYELLVGRLPFDIASQSPGEAEKILLEREPEKPSIAAKRMTYVSDEAGHVRSVGASAWADLDVLCLTAMHKEPDRRYRTVEALIRDIDHFLGQEALEARGDSAGYKLGKFVKRNRASLGIAAAVVIGVVALSGFYAVRVTAARNAALAEASRTARIQKFTVDLLQGGDESVGPADSLRVVSLIDRGVQEARSLDHEPAMQAELFATLGGIYQQLGKLEPADTLLRAALEKRSKLFGSDSREYAETLVSLGMLRNAEAEYDSAEALVRRGLDILKRRLPPTHPAIGSATFSLGQVLDERGDYDRAIAVLEEGVRLQSSSGRITPELTITMTELANAHFYNGNFRVSDSINRQVLVADRRLFGDSHPHVADDLINLGAIQFEFGNYSEAERYYREALAIIRPWYGNDHPETASNLTMLSRALVNEKKLDEASVAATEALAITERAYGPVHPRVASALNELGRIAQQQKRLDDAEAHFRRMAQIYIAVHKDKHYVIGVALSNLAGVMKDRKRYDVAANLFRDVLRRYAEELPPEHQLIGIGKVRYAEVLLLQGLTADARREMTAGYGIIAKQSPPPPVWIARARQGLADIYTSLNQPDSALRYREEIARASRDSAAALASR
jgi:serine/threonine-protein kinase